MELVGGKGYSEGQEKDWMAHLKEDMPVFGTKLEGWRKAAQNAGRWFRRVEERAELFMRNWHETERRKAAERRAKNRVFRKMGTEPKMRTDGFFQKANQLCKTQKKKMTVLWGCTAAFE